MSGRKESVAQRSFFHLSSMRNLFSYVDTAKVRWNGPKKPDGPTAKNLPEKASAQGPNRGGMPVRRNRPTGRHFSHLSANLRYAARRNRPTGWHFSHLGAILRHAVCRHCPTGRHFSHLGFIPRHAAFQRSERAVKKRASQPQTTKHLEKTTKHLEKTTKHLEKTTKHLEKTTRHLEKITKHLEKTTRHLEKNTKHLEKITRHLEKTTKHLEKTTRHLEKTTRHLEKTTRHLEKTTRHLVFPKCLVVFVTSKTGFGLRSCYFQAKLGLISPHFSMAGTMLSVTSSSRILHR